MVSAQTTAARCIVQVEASASQKARGRGTPDLVLTVVGAAEKTLNVYTLLSTPNVFSLGEFLGK